MNSSATMHVYHQFTNDPTTVAKAMAIVVLGVGSFGLGLLPLYLKNGKSLFGNSDSYSPHGAHDEKARSRGVQLLLSFGGGVLLYTAVVHILAEVRASVIQMQCAGRLPGGHGFEQLSELIFFGGFFLVYAVDLLAHAIVDRCAAASRDKRTSGTGRPRNDELHVFHRSASLRRRRPEVPCIPRPSDAGAGAGGPGENDIPMAIRSDMFREPEEYANGGDAAASADQQSFGGLLIVFALSFHEIFEGIVLGLEKDASHVWSLIVAVGFHKLVIAFCVGTEMACAQTRTALVMWAMFAFSGVTVVGIGIGVSILDYGSATAGASDPVSVLIQGVAAGTLLYVVFFEVLDGGNKSHGFQNLLCIVLGFGLMWFTLSIGEWLRAEILYFCLLDDA